MIALDRLPPSAVAKLRALEQGVADAEALARSTFAQIAAANQRLPSRINVRDTSSNDIEAARARREIDEIEAELTRLQSVQRLRNSLAAARKQAVLTVTHWLQRQPPAVRFTAAAPIKVDAGGPGAIEVVRETVARLKAELVALDLAPLPAEDLKKQARELIDRLAQRGAPALNLSRGGFEVRWRSRTDAGVMAMLPEDTIATLCWLDRDAVLTALEAEIDKAVASNPTPPVSGDEREMRRREIATQLLTAERTEEALIEVTPDVARRADASPLAVLGVEFVTEATSAAA